MAIPACDEASQIWERGRRFPLKKRYDESNITLEGVERAIDESDPFRSPELEEARGPQFGASKDWLKPFDPDAESGAEKDGTPPLHSAESGADAGHEPGGSEVLVKSSAYVDKLGRVYPVDSYGNSLRKTCRPFGVTTQEWTSASKKATARNCRGV